MNRQEFATLAAAIRTFYPKENILPNEQAMELWYRELSDIPYSVIEAALRKWVATNKWSPSIAEIRELIINIQYGDQLTWGEAWERALNAVRKYGSYNKKEALDSLDPLTRRCVESIGYMDLCMSENIMVERAHFQKIFEIYSKRQQTDRTLPASLVNAIEQTRKNNALESGFVSLKALGNAEGGT
jgi:hypothetical protein